MKRFRLTGIVAIGLALAFLCDGNAAATQVVYHTCGPNLKLNPNVVIIHWGWNGNDPKNLDKAWRGGLLVGTSKNLNVMSEYYQYPTQNVCSGAQAIPNYALNIRDTYEVSTGPTAPVTTAQEEALVVSVASHYTYDPNTMFVVEYPYATPPIVLPGGSAYPNQYGSEICGYHFTTTGGDVSGVPYAAFPYSDSAYNYGTGCVQSSVMMHEVAETMTDFSQDEWYSASSSSGEVGDLCGERTAFNSRHPRLHRA